MEKNVKEIYECYAAYAEIAKLWNNVAQLLIKISEDQDVDGVNKTTEILVSLSANFSASVRSLSSVGKTFASMVVVNLL